MFNRLIRLVLVFLLSFQTALFLHPSTAGTATPLADPAGNTAPMKVRFSDMLSTSGRNIFYLDYIIPIYYPKSHDTLFFLNPKQTYQNPSSTEYNWGIGFRKTIDDSFILGAHMFFDKKGTGSGNWFSQRGIGLEYLSQPLDVRFNYYHPLSGPKVAKQGYNLGSTTLVHWSNMEEPLQGLDFEFGVPILENKTKTRLYPGGFFYNSHLGKNVNGFRVRSETNLCKWFSIDTSYQKPTVGHDEFMGGFRITMPFELSNLPKGKNPIQQPPQGSYLNERLFDRVVRDIDVQTTNPSSTVIRENVKGVDMIYVNNSNTSGIEDGTLEHPYSTIGAAIAGPSYGDGKYLYVFKGTGVAYAETVNLNPGVVFWGSGSNGGFANLPIIGFPIIDGGGANVITLANNNTVQGWQITNGNNGIFGNNVSGAIIRDNNITENAVNGIYILGNGSSVLTDLTISNNAITGNAASGIFINSDDGVSSISNVTISRNTITGNGNSGLKVQAIDGSSASDFTITGNTIGTADSGNDGNGIYLLTDDGTLSNFTISGNTITGNSGNGIYIDNQYYGHMSNFTISGNTIGTTDSGNDGQGIFINNGYYDGEYDYSNASMDHFDITGNTITGNSGDGIRIENAGYDNGDYLSSMTDFTISNNEITDVARLHAGFAAFGKMRGGGGISIVNDGGELSHFTISGNTISNATEGISIDNYDGGYMYHFDIQGNDIENSREPASGIHLRNDGAEMNTFDISGNTIKDNGGDGLYIGADNESDLADFTITGNTITGNTGDGIYINNQGYGHMSNFAISGNTITGNSGNGISINNGYCRDWGYEYSNAFMDHFDITGNTITGNSGDGIRIENAGYSDGEDPSAMTNFTISGNTITGNTATDSGIHIENNYDGYMDTFDITGNTIKNNHGNGIFVDSYYADSSNFNISGNTITGNTGDGIYMETYDGGSFYNSSISRNTISGNGGYGIDLYSDGGDNFEVDMGGNDLLPAGGYNSIFNNTEGNVYNESDYELKAENNYWGGADLIPDGPDGVDHDPYLRSNPN